MLPLGSRSLLPALLFTLATPAQVQNVVHFPDGNATAGNPNSIPFGQQGIRYQQIVPGSFLRPGSTVQDLFFAPFGSMVSPNTSGEIVYGDIEIRMGITPQVSVTTSWSANNPYPAVVYRGRLRQRWRRDTWVPVGLQTSFPWNPGQPGDNLCIEVIVWNIQSTGNLPYVPGFFSVRSSVVPRAFLTNWTTNQTGPPQVSASDGMKVGLLLDDGNFVGRGEGCPGGNGLRPTLVPRGWPRLGSTFTVDISGLASNTLALPFLGFDEVGTAPATWPFSLSTLGAQPECVLWHDAAAVLPAVTGGSIPAGVPLTIPNAAWLMALRVRISAVVLDPGARGGIATADYGLLIVGS